VAALALLLWSNTSLQNHAIQVGVRVEEEDMRSGARTHCCSAYLTFVAVSGRPTGGGTPMLLRIFAPCLASEPGSLALRHLQRGQ